MNRLLPHNWTLSQKLIGLTLACAAASIAVVGLLNVRTATSALLDQQARSLEAVRTSRQHYIQHYFKIIREQIYNFGQDEMVIQATEAFTDAFARLPDQLPSTAAIQEERNRSLEQYYQEAFRSRLEEVGEPWRGVETYMPTSPSASLLQAMYIAENTNPVGEKHLLDAATESCDYNRLHAHFHPLFRDYLTSFGYYDIFILDLEGNLVYSVFKETDFATNFLSGPYRDTNFAKVYHEARQASTPGTVILEDFQRYEPSYGAPASFIGTPIFKDGEKIGVAVFQMPVDQINTIMSDTSGLGVTGETFLIAADRFMRSSSRFSGTPTILTQAVHTEAAHLALEGSSGTMTLTDYRGIEVLSSFGPLDIEGLQWAMLAEVDMKEITAPALVLRNQMLTYGFGLGGLMIFLFILILRSLVINPVRSLVKGTKQIEKGDYTAHVEVQSSDEMGELSRAFNEMAKAVERDVELRNQAKKQFQLLVELAPFAIIVVDYEGTMELVNSETESLLAYHRDELLGLHVDTLLPHWARGQHPEYRAQYLENPQIRNMESRGGLGILRKDGVEIPVEIGLSPMEFEDETKVICAILDITERKQAEETRRMYMAELKRSNEELEQFAYIASHDLQEPLRKIRAFGDLVRSKYGEALDERGQDYLQRMQNAAARMQTLISDLLSLSRITSKAAPFQAVDLGEVVQTVLNDLDLRIEQVGGRVEVGDLPTIDADRTQMRQLMQNLIGNALKFRRENIPPLVKITCETPSHTTPKTTPSSAYRIQVEDNGIGFEAKHTDRIFKPFQRLHGRNAYEGTGIGLAICHKIVARHGGHLTATSSPGEGATFTIELSQKTQQGDV